MNTRSALAAAAWFSLLFSLASVAAGDYSSLLRAKKFAEAERIASARLAQDPNDGQALAAKSEAIVAAGADRVDEAVSLGEQCVAAHPQLSGCYLAVGNALGEKARKAGPIAAMGYATRVRDSFVKAVELDPNDTDARFALLDYYMQAPAVVGGGKGKARTLAAQTETVNPAAARVMQAQLALAAKDFSSAEATLLSVQPGNDQMVADRQRDLLIELGQHYAAERKSTDSDRVFRAAQRHDEESTRPGRR